MDFDLRVSELDPLHGRLEEAQERVFELQAGTRVDSDEFFSKEFMRTHTQYDSFRAFYRGGSWDLDEAGDMDELPNDRLDGYVAETTEFETWEEMKTAAAEEEILDQLVS
ncbi:hypothetical protein BG842_23715 [Haladaptatus sp. W1]|uniref:hypothetical protein n=1 Tax=Haladaptatus sp. W1 TaxID=1897478 RepID=UPI000849C79A|nr:hypothetical protein [Haladaptatus sp. W1]ODR80787.1 hypothetical protein BG842_23715 [Haladaptatus sp. W1]